MPPLFLTLLLAACETSARRECDFGESSIVATADAIGDVAFARFGRVQHVLYETHEGLFAIDEDQRRTRLGPPCMAFDVLELEGDRAAVACALPPSPAKDDAGRIDMLVLGGGEARRVALPYAVGREHLGLSLAAGGDSLELAYHDGRPGRFHVRHVVLGNVDSLDHAAESRLLSTPSVPAGPPHLQIDDGERRIVWAEGQSDPQSEPTGFRGYVYLHRSRAGSPAAGRPRRLLPVIDPRSRPRLGPQGAVYFRDVRRPIRRPGLFVSFDPDQPPERVGRAGNRGALPLRCGGLNTAVVARPYGRHDRLVSIHLLDERFQPVAAEQQVYEWASQFHRVDAYCSEGTLELAVAERSRLDGRPARLHRLSLRCE
ncbi:MAG: hypothetical protein AAF411_29345 [Myxococcota bacterium]